LSSRAEQKSRTRRALMDAALAQLSADRSFGSLSLREVTRQAGLAPTSFYRHFTDLDELGMTLVDEGGVALRQLMRQARRRIVRNGDDGSAIATSIDTFMEYLQGNANLFRLMLRERTGLSEHFRTAIKAEIDHVATELAVDLRRFAAAEGRRLAEPKLVAEAMVALVFSQGAEALDASAEIQEQLKVKLKIELRMVLLGAQKMGAKGCDEL